MGRRPSRDLLRSTVNVSCVFPPDSMVFAFTLSLSPIWAVWIASLQLPCKVQLNREHVIPKSKLPKYITEQHHNIIGFPAYLNHRRGNIKYTDSDKPGVPIWPCKTCKRTDCPFMAKLNKDGFTPPSIYKPVIGASILRSMYNHPEIVDIVHSEVLDIGIALSWTNQSYESLPSSIKDIFMA